MAEFIGVGLVLGLAAGLAPGPLLALVVAETLRHGVRAGIRVAFAPVFTDLPVIVLSLFVLAQLAAFRQMLGGVSLLGGAVLLHMAYGCMKAQALPPASSQAAARSLLKGIAVNALSPHPYLFWMGVGGPLIRKAADSGAGAAMAFVGSFYALLVVSKILLALLVGRSRHFLGGTLYVSVMRLLGAALLVLAGLLFRDGLALLGLVSP